MFELQAMLAAWTPATAGGIALGASAALLLSAAAQRLPRRWGPSEGHAGRSRKSQPPAQDASGAITDSWVLAEPPRSTVMHPADVAAEIAAREEVLPPEIARWQDNKINGPRRIAAVKAGHILIAFMQRQGATGYFTVKEIDAWWRYCREKEGLDYLHPTVVRGELSGIRNVWIGLKRLNGPEYRGVKARNEGVDRAILYKIPLCLSGAGALPDETRQNRHATGITSGKRPANPKKRVLSGPESWSGEALGACVESVAA